FQYGVRICPEPVHWGGLSGCTYSEGVSWGKFVSYEEGGRYAEVLCDATVVFPLLMKAIFEELDG
ncbi:MAG: deoxyhypusine synthase family protein, partial [Candidatus Hydrogenedentes bacterium]|nr:deoxyhypusine synthase family protein [Candidatus Hydrogenedentota bacterium]